MNRIRILLVDDHSMFREGLRRLLEMEEDLEVVAEAGTGAEAEARVDAQAPDVVLMDVGLPDQDGAVTAANILRRQPGCRVLMLTMHGDQEKVLTALAQGAKGYVLKTASADELVRAIRTVHQGEQFLSPTAAQALVADWHRIRQGKPASGRLGLSPGETEVLSLLARGMSNREIAQHLYLSEKTVRNRLSVIFHKLGVKNRSQAILHLLGQTIPEKQ